MSFFAACIALSACAVASDAGPAVPSSEVEGPERQAAAVVEHFLKLAKKGRMAEAARLSGVPCEFGPYLPGAGEVTAKDELAKLLNQREASNLFADVATLCPDAVEVERWEAFRGQLRQSARSRIDAVLRPADYCVTIGTRRDPFPIAFLIRMEAGKPVVVGVVEVW
jgi:hypothetical protein